MPLNTPKPEHSEGGDHPERLGHYRVIELIGAGLVTNVYRADAAGLGRVVALKVLRSKAGPVSAFHRRFEREARLLSTLRHPNVVELLDYDAGIPGEEPPYMVLEHVSGATLSEVLPRLARLPPDEVAAIGFEIARALSYAHALGIVHRDVKPGNVLIGVVGGVDITRAPIVVKLADFGIAYAPNLASGDAPRPRLPGDEDEGDASTEPIGTPAYMAPEQLLGEAVDHRADQFALGVVLYQMLAGTRPFDGDDGRPAIQRVRRDPPKSFRALGITVPRALEQLVLRCLAKRPADRYEETSEIATELARVLEGRVETPADTGPILRRILSRAGFIEERRALREEAPASLGSRRSPARPRAVPLTPTLVGLGVALFALSAGGAVIQLRLGPPRSTRAGPAASASTAVESLETGGIRVNVRPWGDILVDGQRVGTTPIARALRVRPGKHVVTIVHPVSSERRVIDVRAGETVWLDVVLPVSIPAYADEFAKVEASASASASGPVRPPPAGK